jgi:hypothetical protein
MSPLIKLLLNNVEFFVKNRIVFGDCLSNKSQKEIWAELSFNREIDPVGAVGTFSHIDIVKALSLCH